MSAEDIVRGALDDLVDGQVYVGVAPDGRRAPWIVYQLVGGTYLSDLEGTLCRTARARMQVSVWGQTARQCGKIMSQVVDALVNRRVRALPIGAPASTYEVDTRLFGSRMEFLIVFELGVKDG